MGREGSRLVAEQPNTRRPETPLQALMEAGRGEPEESQDELEERMKLWIGPLEEALSGLTDRERYIVHEVVIQGRSYRHVARELGINPSNVYRYLHGDESGPVPKTGALNKLRKHIEEATEVEI
jgi:DNA-directed RNA polymerase specialized sigma24 family protein